MYDYLIKNGLVVDGSGKPAVKADVAVKGDKVARIAPDIQEPAAEVYDAAGKYVIPGLIDPHVHEEWYCFDDGRYESYIRQGVTTLVNGNCSHSITPGHKKEVLDYYLGNGLVGLKQYQRYLRDWPDWHDFEGYAQAVEQVGTNCNFVTLLGHGSIRQYVMHGAYNRARTPSSSMAFRAMSYASGTAEARWEIWILAPVRRPTSQNSAVDSGIPIWWRRWAAETASYRLI